MKKLIIKSVFMIAVFLGISNYMLHIITGKSPFSGFTIPDFSLNTPSLDAITPAKSHKVYKWVDANGVTQYSNEPPPEEVQATTLELDPNLNIVQGTKIPEKQKEKPESEPEVALPQGPVYSPDTIKKLMDDAQNVQTLLNERHEKQQKALEDL